MKRFMIAGTKSGVGKTTIAMGIMAALSKRMIVQPYKVGPDYIDPAFHRYITGRNCSNLDSYILSDAMIHYLYNKNLKDAEVAIVEGVMGLFDGAEVGSDVGTSASIAKTLKLPIILVVDGSKVATSLAATVKGFEIFDPELTIDGVIINNVGSAAHYDLLKRGIEYHTNVKPCGYLMKNSALSLPERHLGLVPASEQVALDDIFLQLAEAIEETVDIEGLLALAETTGVDSLDLRTHDEDFKVFNSNPLRIGIAKDKAFNFYYPDALQLLEDLGSVTWVEFSPLNDNALPENLDGLYIGGGFPEVFAKELAQNKGFMTSLTKKLEDGMPYLAECGGLMYLCEALIDLEGVSSQMLAWLPGTTEMTPKLQRFGYAELALNELCILGNKGSVIRIHEFHRSKASVNLPTRYNLKKVRHQEVIKEWSCGYIKGNGIAAYAHMHFAGNLSFAKAFVQSCLTYKKEGNNGIY